MDLANEGKTSFKVNKKLITLIVNLPASWLVGHLFNYGLGIKEVFYTSGFLKHAFRTGQMIKEYEKYRQNIYTFYVIFFFIAVIFIIIESYKKRKIGNIQKESGEKSWTYYLIPASIQGTIFSTFSYLIATFLIEVYFFLKNLI